MTAGRRASSGSDCRRTSGRASYAALARSPKTAASTSSRPSTTSGTSPRCPRCSRSPQRPNACASGPSCLNPYTVHPVELAGQIAALDLASRRSSLPRAGGGRVAGRARRRAAPPGRSDRRGMGDRVAPARRRPLGLRGRGVPARARRAASPTPRSGARVPLLVGTWSPRLTAFAAEHADELKLGGTRESRRIVRLTRDSGSARPTSGSSPGR